MQNLLVLACLALSIHGSHVGRTAAAQAGAVATAPTPAPIPASSVDAESFGLELPVGRPDRLTLEVPFEGRLRRLDLRRHSLRSQEARARVWGAGNRWTMHELGSPGTYRGVVEGERDRVVLAYLTSDGLHADVLPSDGSEEGAWSMRPAGRPGRYRAQLQPSDHGASLHCGVEELGLGSGGVLPKLPQPSPRRCASLAEIAFDADFEYYTAKGSSVSNVIDTIEGHMNQVDFYYARDVRITYELTEFVVRTAPFYTPTTGGELLDQFRAEWNTNLAFIPRDMAHLMTAKPGNLIQYGGLAWVGGVCNSIAYGWSLDSAGIIGHEVGHNWNAGHCLDPTPCNNMCGSCFHVGPNTKQVIEAYRDSRPCLQETVYAGALPPYVAPDELRLAKDELAAGGAFTIDVLANDEDGNCEPIFLRSSGQTTARGGRAEILRGAGPQHRDLIQYSPPAVPFIGVDDIPYFVSDGTFDVPATLTVDVASLQLAGYWRLDDGSGTSAADESLAGRAGTLLGNPLWTSGLLGTALSLDGLDDAVQIPPLDLQDDSVTITAWLKRTGPLVPSAGIVFSRAGSTAAGITVGSFGDLRYSWNADPLTFNKPTGFIPPLDQWVFTALVVEPTAATFYFHDGALRTVTNPIPHDPEAFDGDLYLGLDEASATRRFEGALDDVRVYDHALSSGEVLDLVSLGGRADVPYPSDGADLPDPTTPLGWVASPLATAHEVYLDTDYVRVRDADPSSPAYMGSFAVPSFQPPSLVSDTRYFWRVDEVVGTGTVRGDVWQFELADFARWKLDEVSGSAALDSQGTFHGVYVGDPTLGGAGASAKLGTSVSFDGAGDRVDVAMPMALDSNRVTMTAWVKRNGAQNAFAALIFSRAGSTTAGLNFGTADELRYHWNGSASTYNFDSGLVVPDQEWVFTALVVEPDRATLYLGQDGTLSAATNFVTHPVEAFDGKLVIGQDPNFGNRYLRGDLDDPRVYDAALSPAEIDALYQRTR